MITIMLILIILSLLAKTSLYQPKIIKNYQKFLAKGLNDWCIGLNIKQKVRVKVQQTSTEILLNQILSELIDCLLWFIQTKMVLLKDLMATSKGVIKNYNVNITEKKLYSWPIDSDIKRYKEIRKVKHRARLRLYKRMLIRL